jgi:hypothetical protein
MGHAASAGPDIAPAAVASTPHAHHAAAPAPAAAAQGAAGPGLDHLSALAIPLSVFFATATVIFIALLLRNRATKTTTAKQSTSRHSTRIEVGLEALGAAVMALMFATMSA